MALLLGLLSSPYRRTLDASRLHSETGHPEPKESPAGDPGCGPGVGICRMNSSCNRRMLYPDDSTRTIVTNRPIQWTRRPGRRPHFDPSRAHDPTTHTAVRPSPTRHKRTTPRRPHTVRVPTPAPAHDRPGLRSRILILGNHADDTALGGERSLGWRRLVRSRRSWLSM